MTWTEWNERIGSKIVDRAFSIIGNRGYALADVEAALRQARRELAHENGSEPYDPVTEH